MASIHVGSATIECVDGDEAYRAFAT
jgi:hypothetical protein